MKLPQIQIRTTDAQIDLNIARPQQYIKQPRATQQIEQPAATLEIHTTRSVLKIDSSQARRDLGLIEPLESSANYAQKGKQEALKGMARRAREGRQMMENAGKDQGRATIQNIAKQNHWTTPGAI
ncbi:YviE OS=Lysinibacillus sphaericus OX=1421 GN=LS41612_19590 PE=4 SV=1 [Lysinibacillus sphaericus]